MKARAQRREKKKLFEGGFHNYLEKLFDCITLDLLWLLCCIPVITIGAATTAFYYTTVKVIRGERGHLFSAYWHSFKLNFAPATILWLLFAVLLVIVGINRNIAPDIDDGYFGLFLICVYTGIAVLLSAVMCYAFSALSRFEMSLWWILKMAVYMTFRYFHYTLGILGIAGAAAVIIYYLPLLILGVPIGACVLIAGLMEKVLIRHTPLPGTAEEAEEKWYLKENYTP